MAGMLYRNWDPITGRWTTMAWDHLAGCPVIKQGQDIEPIIESAKRIASNFDPLAVSARRDGQTHVARIPSVIWQRLNELGIARDEQALTAWLNDPDNRVFRCDDGRKL